MGRRVFIRASAYEIVWIQQEVRIFHLKISIERNQILLVRPQSLELSPTSIKRDKIKKKMTEKMFNTIMVGCADNHTRDTYKLYNP